MEKPKLEYIERGCYEYRGYVIYQDGIDWCFGIHRTNITIGTGYPTRKSIITLIDESLNSIDPQELEGFTVYPIEPKPKVDTTHYYNMVV